MGVYDVTFTVDEDSPRIIHWKSNFGFSGTITFEVSWFIAVVNSPCCDSRLIKRGLIKCIACHSVWGEVARGTPGWGDLYRTIRAPEYVDSGEFQEWLLTPITVLTGPLTGLLLTASFIDRLGIVESWMTGLQAREGVFYNYGQDSATNFADRVAALNGPLLPVVVMP